MMLLVKGFRFNENIILNISGRVKIILIVDVYEKKKLNHKSIMSSRSIIILHKLCG